jgi:hypothetical protein
LRLPHWSDSCRSLPTLHTEVEGNQDTSGISSARLRQSHCFGPSAIDSPRPRHCGHRLRVSMRPPLEARFAANDRTSSGQRRRHIGAAQTVLRVEPGRDSAARDHHLSRTVFPAGCTGRFAVDCGRRNQRQSTTIGHRKPGGIVWKEKLKRGWENVSKMAE